MPRTLLLADDSITMQKVVAIILAHEDFSLVTVDNGEDAIVKARELMPDVVVADVVMPVRSGYDVCAQLKSDPATQRIPVLLLSGAFEEFDEARAKAAGADGHLAKPFDSASFLAKLKSLGGPAEARPAAVQTASATAVAPAAAQPRTPAIPMAPGIEPLPPVATPPAIQQPVAAPPAKQPPAASDAGGGMPWMPASAPWAPRAAQTAPAPSFAQSTPAASWDRPNEASHGGQAAPTTKFGTPTPGPGGAFGGLSGGSMGGVAPPFTPGPTPGPISVLTPGPTPAFVPAPSAPSSLGSYSSPFSMPSSLTAPQDSVTPGPGIFGSNQAIGEQEWSAPAPQADEDDWSADIPDIDISAGPAGLPVSDGPSMPPPEEGSDELLLVEAIGDEDPFSIPEPTPIEGYLVAEIIEGSDERDASPVEEVTPLESPPAIFGAFAEEAAESGALDSEQTDAAFADALAHGAEAAYEPAPEAFAMAEAPELAPEPHEEWTGAETPVPDAVAAGFSDAPTAPISVPESIVVTPDVAEVVVAPEPVQAVAEAELGRGLAEASRELVERIGWEVVPQVTESLLREQVAEASRGLIEKIVWEVVPQLAETIIREEVERLVRERRIAGL